MPKDGLAAARRADILLIDDSPRDVRLVREALREIGGGHRLHVASTPQQALALLRREPPHEKAARPDLVLLDINLRGSSGIDLLQVIKQDVKLCVIPVLMLSTSRAKADVLASYRHHANCYLVKPLDYSLFGRVLDEAIHYWLSTVEPAPEASHV
jgi:two-component system, chemotaxis family, response regulator Rcp1